jgi:four helix bundle protein
MRSARTAVFIKLGGLKLNHNPTLFLNLNPGKLMPKHYFDHEKLKVYQTTIKFVAWVSELRDELNLKNQITDHLDRASNSIVLNIAEGNGRFTSKNRCHFFDIARGSALECSASLDLMVAKKIVAQKRMEIGKEMLKSIVSMLVGLIKSNSNRVYSPEIKYGEDTST